MLPLSRPICIVCMWGFFVHTHWVRLQRLCTDMDKHTVRRRGQTQTHCTMAWTNTLCTDMDKHIVYWHGHTHTNLTEVLSHVPLDIDECQTTSTGCVPGGCVNLPGDYFCTSCIPGYSLDQGSKCQSKSTNYSLKFSFCFSDIDCYNPQPCFCNNTRDKSDLMVDGVFAVKPSHLLGLAW